MKCTVTLSGGTLSGGKLRIAYTMEVAFTILCSSYLINEPQVYGYYQEYIILCTLAIIKARFITSQRDTSAFSILIGPEWRTILLAC